MLSEKNWEFKSKAMNAKIAQTENNGICEIRWHGRGGQGAVSSAKMLAAAGFNAGFKGVTSAPSFGAERRGAPVTASTRLAVRTIRAFSQPETPSVVIVLDETLMKTADTLAGLKPGGWIIINSHHAPEYFDIPDTFCCATANASAAAKEAGLVISGAVMVNTAMLGAVARATELISLEDVEIALGNAFSSTAAQRNLEAARLTYERTQLNGK